MAILLIIGSIIFVTGSILDAGFSRGLKEKNALYKDSRGYFSFKKYVLWSVGALAGVWIFAAVVDQGATWITSAIAAGASGVYRLYVALSTKKKLAER
jgi:uncharacterized membrane protein